MVSREFCRLIPINLTVSINVAPCSSSEIFMKIAIGQFCSKSFIIIMCLGSPETIFIMNAMKMLVLKPYVGRNILPSEFGRTEPNRHTIYNSYNFHLTQTRRFPLCTDLPMDLVKGLLKQL